MVQETSIFLTKITDTTTKAATAINMCVTIKLFNKLPKNDWKVNEKNFQLFGLLDNWLELETFFSIDEYLNCDTSYN